MLQDAVATPVEGPAILDLCRRHYLSAADITAGLPDLGNRWGVFAKRMQAAIMGFTTLDEAIWYGQLRCDFDHRGLVAESDRAEIDITRRLLRYEYPKLAEHIDRFTDSPISAPGSFLDYGASGAEPILRNKIIYFHAMYVLTTASHLGSVASVCEIGGGSGGPCWHFLTNDFSGTKTYCIVDLPESLFFAEAFLRAAMPDALVHYAGVDALDRASIDDGRRHIVLVPLHLHRETRALQFDLVINTGSMAEMTDEWLSFWSDWIDAQTTDHFYSSNYFGNPVNKLFEGRATLAPLLPKTWMPSFIRSMPVMMKMHSEERQLSEIIFTRDRNRETSLAPSMAFVDFDGLPMSAERYIYGTYLHRHFMERDPQAVLRFAERTEAAFGYQPVELLALLMQLKTLPNLDSHGIGLRDRVEAKVASLENAFRQSYPRGTHSD